jgi:hypothetical protein
MKIDTYALQLLQFSFVLLFSALSLYESIPNLYKLNEDGVTESGIVMDRVKNEWSCKFACDAEYWIKTNSGENINIAIPERGGIFYILNVGKSYEITWLPKNKKVFTVKSFSFYNLYFFLFFGVSLLGYCCYQLNKLFRSFKDVQA